jgi:hypothetical protein
LPDVLRRESRHGSAISLEAGKGPAFGGLPLAGDAALPFLLAARAQGELAAVGGGARAFFAEGLCSSYEAFHHTRDARGHGRDAENDEPVATEVPAVPTGIVPLSWYEEQIGWLIPSRDAGEQALACHPKVRAVVDRVLQLWREGEKVLVFCFYRESVKGLHSHLAREIERETTTLAARKLGLDPTLEAEEVCERLDRLARRLSDRDSPSHRQLLEVLRRELASEEFKSLAASSDDIVQLLAAYVRSRSFLARYFPLDSPDVPEALEEALTNRSDASAQTMLHRVQEFLRFASDLAEKGQRAGQGDTFLQTYLQSLAAYLAPRADEGDGAEAATYRTLPVVRLVHGATKREVRERLMLAFNSPLFPEVLVSSSVLGEGVDLHRFCRHVIHHDLDWNPSVLEQRTGRLDRIRCKAEVARRPIVIFEPFLSGSADEKMFRVVRDRERWFQIVMGQKFEFDEAASDELAWRVPLPDDLAPTLIFDLRRFVPGATTK